MFGGILTLLYYGSLCVIILVIVGFVYLGKTLLKANDFPNKRRYCTSTVQLNGKTVIVTGGYSSIGYETAKEFARRGARVILPYRSEIPASETRNKIIAETGNRDIELMKCDLSDLESVKRFCQDFIERESSLHILVNNAVHYGIGDEEGYTTKQGFNMVVGVNYVGHFLLTFLLLDLLKQSAPSRIINVSSGSHYNPAELDLTPRDSNGNLLPNLKGYGPSKLLNVLHTKYLARILEGTGVSAFTLHPGFIIGSPSRFPVKPILRAVGYFFRLYKPISLTPYQGAQTTLYCALEESLNTSGKYYDNCKERRPNRLAEDSDLVKRVWDVTLHLLRDVLENTNTAS